MNKCIAHNFKAAAKRAAAATLPQVWGFGSGCSGTRPSNATLSILRCRLPVFLDGDLVRSAEYFLVYQGALSW